MKGFASAAFLAAGLAFAAPASAQEEGKISVEFNALQPAEEGCRAVFVLHNGLATPIDKFALRIVAFDENQQASLFLSLDVGALPVDKTRVVRFDFGGELACDKVSRLVLDDVIGCEGEGLDPAACLGLLALSSRANVPIDS
jgi:hypothetical protein